MDNADVVWKRIDGKDVFFYIHVSGLEYLLFKPNQHPGEEVGLGTATCDEPFTMLGEAIPVDLGPYRDRLEQAYNVLAYVNEKYGTGRPALDDADRAALDELYRLFKSVTSPIQHTQLGHS